MEKKFEKEYLEQRENVMKLLENPFNNILNGVDALISTSQDYRYGEGYEKEKEEEKELIINEIFDESMKDIVGILNSLIAVLQFFKERSRELEKENNELKKQLKEKNTNAIN